MLNSLFGKLYAKTEGNNRIERIWKLAQVDFKKRYHNDKLGLIWALINPLSQILVYFFVFKFIIGVREENYIFFLYLGLITFKAFTEMGRKGLNMIKSKRYLIENIQLNKLDFYIAAAISSLQGFLFELAIYLVSAVVYGLSFNLSIVLLPFLILNIFLLGIAAAFLLTTAQIFIADVKHIWTIVSLFGFWTSGIFFPGEKILAVYPQAALLNPFIGIIDNIRSILLYNGSIDLSLFFSCLAIGVLWILIGYALISKYWKYGIEKL